MKKVKLRNVAMIACLAVLTVFSSCNKDKDEDSNVDIVYYNVDDIEGITKIKELLKDADCDKGIVCNGTVTSSYGIRPFSGTMYCDEWNVDATNVDEFLRDLGAVSSAKYQRSKQMAVIVFKGTGTYGGYGSYYIGNFEATYSFYTKGKH